jgi:hypothetical protein
VPGVTPVADELLKSAGFKDMHPGVPPVPPAAAAAQLPPPEPTVPDPLLADGAAAGIQTATGADGAIQQGAM